MTAEESILELLVLWEEGAARGADLGPADLCPDRPEWWPALADRIAIQKRVRAALLVDDPQAARDTSATGQGVTQVVPRTDGVAEVIAKLAPPQRSDELGRLGPYRVLAVLGSGGMGVIFRAEEPALGRLVALKVMRGGADHATARERFLREAKLAASLEHDHVVPVFQVGEAGGLPYLAMPLLRGETLAERLDRDGKLSPAETARVGREAAEGLAAAHARGLIHRDVKPANLWLEDDRGRVKLLDFGLARGSGDATITGTGAVLGTPAFMAPEQARGEEADGRADLFSLGCTLYRCATGRLPFTAPDAVSTLLAIARDTPPPPHEVNPDIPAALSAVITRLLAKDRNERPATAHVVADELASLQSGESSPPTEVFPAVAPVKAPPRKRRRVAVAALFPALIVLGGVIILIKNKDGSTTKIETDDGATVEVQKDGKTVAKVGPGIPTPVIPSFPAVAGTPVSLDATKIPADERFDWQPKELVAVLGTHRLRQWGPIEKMKYNRDGSMVAARSTIYGGNVLRVWDVATGRVRAEVPFQGHWPNFEFHPDGKTLIVDNRLTHWDISRSPPLKGQEQQSVTQIGAVAPDGKTAYGRMEIGKLGSVRAWRYENGRLEMPGTDLGLPIRGFATLAPDCQTLVDIDQEQNKLYLWKIADAKARMVAELPVKKGKGDWAGYQFGFTPDGRRFIGATSQEVVLWDLTGDAITQRDAVKFRDQVYAVALSPDGKSLAISTALGASSGLAIWDVSGDSPREMATRADIPAGVISWHPSGKSLAYSSNNGVVQFCDWDGKTLTPRPATAVGPGAAHELRFDAAGRTLFVRHSFDGVINRWRCDGKTFSPLAPVTDPDMHGIRSMAIDAGEKRVVASANDSLWLWDLQPEKPNLLDRQPHTVPHNPIIASSRDGKQIAVGHSGEQYTGPPHAWIRETSGGRLRPPMAIEHPENGKPFTGGFLPDGKTFLTGCADGKLRVWDVSGPMPKLKQTVDAQAQQQLVVSPDGSFLVCSSVRTEFEVWDITAEGLKLRGKLPFAGERPGSNGGGVRISADGRSLAVGGAWPSFTCGVWPIPTAAELKQMQADGKKLKARWAWEPPGNVPDVTFLPDGRHLALANGNGTVYVVRLPDP